MLRLYLPIVYLPLSIESFLSPLLYFPFSIASFLNFLFSVSPSLSLLPLSPLLYRFFSISPFLLPLFSFSSSRSIFYLSSSISSPLYPLSPRLYLPLFPLLYHHLSNFCSPPTFLYLPLFPSSFLFSIFSNPFSLSPIVYRFSSPLVWMSFVSLFTKNKI